MRVRINNNKPNAAQRKVLRQECIKEFDKLLEDFNRQAAMQVACVLRFEFGFGQERLERFFDRLAEMRAKTTTRYEVEDSEVPDICEIKLRESGIDVEKLFKE